MSPGQVIDVVVVTGLSGSGKTEALRAMEDLRYFCIDNLPVFLLDKLLELGGQGAGEITRLALGLDARDPKGLSLVSGWISARRHRGEAVRVLYLEAGDDQLVRRFTESRRPHPLDRGEGLLAGIAAERSMLTDLRGLADVVLDTSGMSTRELRRRVAEAFAGTAQGDLSLAIVSFGFKHGLPPEASLVFDVRFLANPYFVPELSGHSGLDPQVKEYVLSQREALDFLDRVADLLTALLPLYEREGRRYLTVAIGCTGGRHRSVVLAEELGRRLAQTGVRAPVRHRDVGRT